MVDEGEDDWAPLQPEPLALSPWAVDGSPADPAASQVKVVKPALPVAPMPERRTEKPLSPHAEQMVRELQDRVAKAGPGSSLIAQVQHREMRNKRKQQAAQRVAEQLTATCVNGEQPSESESTFEISAKSDLDPRELESWFRELPEAEQSRLRAVWHDARHKFDNAGEIYRTRLKRAICYGALAFFGMSVALVLIAGGFHMVPVMTFAGAVAGATAHVLGGGRFVYAGCGICAYMSVVGSGITGNPFTLYGLLLAAFVMGAIGMDGEMRRSAGYSKD